MNRTPLTIAIVLLLLPVLYVGGYLALVDYPNAVRDPFSNASWSEPRYRVRTHYAASFFWPLEQVDRAVRPKHWEPWFPPAIPVIPEIE